MRHLRTAFGYFSRTVVLDVLLLRRTLARSPVRWVMHMSMFYGFLALAALSGLGLMLDIVEHFNLAGFAHEAEMVKGMMALPFDVFGYLLLFGSTIAISRRILIKFVRDNTSAYDALLIGAVFLITVTGFYAEWMRGNSFLVGNMFRVSHLRAPLRSDSYLARPWSVRLNSALEQVHPRDCHADDPDSQSRRRVKWLITKNQSP